jgi:hypothetical protein
MTIKQAYLGSAAVASRLTADPAVAATWSQPSSLPDFTVAGLAGHLARQTLLVAELLAREPEERASIAVPITLFDHYTRSSWVGSSKDAPASVATRSHGEAQAAAGYGALLDQLDLALDSLPALLAAQNSERLVRLPWAGWWLTLEDFLTTRMLEIAVHCDDLAVSTGLETPKLSPEALEPVIALLTRLAVHRHGAVAVVRALSRAERAPASIAAI